MIYYRLSVLFALMVLTLSCQKESPPSQPQSNILAGTTWQLAHIDAIGGNSISIDQSDTILIQFDDELHLSGNSRGACKNTYFGTFVSSILDSIHIDSVSSTKVGCPKSHYWAYIPLLSKAESYNRTDSELTINCVHGSPRLVFHSVR